jgi:hypothetical protein
MMTECTWRVQDGNPTGLECIVVATETSDDGPVEECVVGADFWYISECYAAAEAACLLASKAPIMFDLIKRCYSGDSIAALSDMRIFLTDMGVDVGA